MGIRQVLMSTVVVSLLSGAAHATLERDLLWDDDRMTSSIEGGEAPVVDEIVFAGLRRISPVTVRMQLACRVGQRFDAAMLARDVRQLARLGWFASIRVRLVTTELVSGISELSPQHVQLAFEFQENPLLIDVAYEGSRLLSSRQIDKLLVEKQLAPKLGDPENPVSLHQIAAAIRDALASAGHPEGRVEIRRSVTTNATVRVRFAIADGPRLVVGRVTFAGDPRVPANLLRRQMRRIRPGGWWRGLRGRNSYTQEGFEEDRERLLAYYQDHGYPEARIGEARVSRYEAVSRRWIPWRRGARTVRLDVEIPAQAGIPFRVESVRVAEEVAQRSTPLHKPLMAVGDAVQGRPYSAREIENLRRAWQARVQPREKTRHKDAGNFCSVEVVRTFDPNAGTVRIMLQQSLRPPYTVRRLDFRGLHRFPDKYFRSRILLTEGSPFDDRRLESGLARIARTSYFKPIKKEDIHVEANEAAHSVDVTIRVEELGQQRAFLTGGHGQFGSTLGVAYTVFNLLDRDELLSSHIEGGPESLQLAIGFAKQGFLGSRGALALSVFDTFLRPRLSGSVRGPFFRQESSGIDATYSYALTNGNSLSVRYDLSHAKTQYSPALPSGVAGLTVNEVPAETSSHSMGFGWTHDTGDTRILFADSVSGGWLGGSENLVRAKAEFGRVVPDAIFRRENSWAFRYTLTGVGSYSGSLPAYSRLFAGDDFVRGLRPGELGPDAVALTLSPAGATNYTARPAGANLVSAANLEYRARIADRVEVAGFFDLGSGKLLPNWLGSTRSVIADFTNGLVHASTGVQLQWTLPGIGVPVRVYYAVNVLRLNRWLPMPDGTLFHAYDRFAAFGWGLGSLF
jgi:outer membrane protein assembly complex protein YaeT